MKFISKHSAVRVLVVLFLISGLFSLKVFSQDCPKIGYLNVSTIVSELPESDTIQKTLNKEAKQLSDVLEEMQVEYNKLVKDFNDKLDSLQDVEKESKQMEINDLSKRIDKFRTDANNKMQKRNTELVQPLYDKINKAIKKVAEELKLMYVLDTGSGAVVYTAENSIDISDRVLKELGEQNIINDK